MKWTKKGRIYVPDGRLWWAKKYAFPPTPYFLNDRVLRIYVSFCDENTIGRVGYVEVDAEDPANVLRVSSLPVLDIGTPGAFDENGVLPTCIVPVEDRLYLYYVGYQLGYRVRYFQFEGLAVSKDGGESFQRLQRTPVIDRSENELVNRTSSFVMREGGVFKMWYVGGSDWRDVHGKMLPVYKLRYLESSDGIHWPSEGRVCLDFRDADEHAFGRPWVFRRSRALWHVLFGSHPFARLPPGLRRIAGWSKLEENGRQNRSGRVAVRLGFADDGLLQFSPLSRSYLPVLQR